MKSSTSFFPRSLSRKMYDSPPLATAEKLDLGQLGGKPRRDTAMSSGLEMERASRGMAQYRLLVTSVHARLPFIVFLKLIFRTDLRRLEKGKLVFVPMVNFHTSFVVVFSPVQKT